MNESTIFNAIYSIKYFPTVDVRLFDTRRYCWYVYYPVLLTGFDFRIIQEVCAYHLKKLN